MTPEPDDAPDDDVVPVRITRAPDPFADAELREVARDAAPYWSDRVWHPSPPR